MRSTSNHFGRLSGGRCRVQVAARCVGSALLYVSCTSLAVWAGGCGDDDGPPPGSDAGTSDGDGGGGAHGALAVDVVGELGPLEGGQMFESASLTIMELRVRNDRGGDFEPMITSPATIDLASGASFEILDAAPATYARVTIRIAPSGMTPAFAMRIAEASRTFDVRLETPLDVETSCAAPVVLGPRGSARLQITVRIHELAQQLDESTVPEPVDGVVHVDEDTAPEAASALLGKLAEAFELACEHVESGG